MISWPLNKNRKKVARELITGKLKTLRECCFLTLVLAVYLVKELKWILE